MNDQPQIIVFSDEQWAIRSADMLNRSAEAVYEQKGSCSIMLTGGRGAEKIYKAWSALLSKKKYRLLFYFGDERCVPPDAVESNYRMARNSLFPGEVPNNFSFFRLRGEFPDREAEAKQYEELIPDQIDILLLSIGEDGHIASLFPGAPALLEKDHKITIVTSPKPPAMRFTITPGVIRSARKIFCFASGESKGQALAAAMRNPDDAMAIPARLALNATWLIDESAKKFIIAGVYQQQIQDT